MARIRFVAGVLAGAAALFALVGHGLVNYDTLYSLVWGRELVDGIVPNLGVSFAPTPHPLATLGGIVLAPLSTAASGGIHGEAATTVVVAFAFVALALLCWVVFALGRAWFNTAAGVLAAVIVATRVPVLDFGARAYVDVPYVALVLGALLVETRRPRAGGPVLVLLALAGLLRPEAWLFSAAYVVWLVAPGMRAAARGSGPQRAAAVRDAMPLLAIAASGPLLWALHDLLLTGDALHSLTGTQENGDELGRVTGLQNVPLTVPRRIGEVLREPVLLAAAGGGVMALVWRRDRRVRLAASAGVLSVASTCVLAAAGLPLLTRYMLLTASVLAIFAAAGVFGWMALARGAQRTWWARFAALAVVVLLVFAPDQVHRIDRLGGALGTQARIQDDLATLVGPGLPCRPLAVANRRPIPLLALWLRIAPERIVDAQRAVPARGTYVVPRTPEVARAYILDKRDRDREIRPPPAGFRPLRANASWRASVSC